VHLVGRRPGRRRVAAWSQMVLHVAISAARAGLPEEALRWAERLDVERLDPVPLAARAQVIAVASIALRDRARAREVVASVPRPVPALTWERALAGARGSARSPRGRRGSRGGACGGGARRRDGPRRSFGVEDGACARAGRSRPARRGAGGAS
jgi:hypothetical protein